MAQVITIEGSIPEDFPEKHRNPKIKKAATDYIHGLLGLRKHDKVVLKIREVRA